jgi:hypothetical protein
VSPHTRARVACAAAAALALVLAALVVVLALDPSYEPDPPISSGLPDALMALAFAAVGAIVTLRRPGNLVGWALWLAGAGLLFGGVASAYGELALLAKPEAGLPGGAQVAALSAGSWTPLMAGVFLLLVAFPAGRIPPGWRRVVPLVVAGFAAVWIAISTAPGKLEAPFERFANPLAVTQSKLSIAAIVPVIAFCLVAVAVAGVNLVVRFRRSRGDERQQFKLIAASAGFLVAMLPFGAAFNYSGAVGVAMTLALTALPLSVGVAVLRYRLYEIDRVISRTLVYTALTVVLVAAYAGLVLAGQALFSSFAGGSDLAIAVSTLVVAAVALPVRARLQRFVDRRFYRRRYDAQRTLEAFGARLREQIDLETLQVDLRTVVTETMQPSHATVWLRKAVSS